MNLPGASKLLTLGGAAMLLTALIWTLLVPANSQSAQKLSDANDFFIGRQGENPGEFQQPRGIAAFADGSFIVVDRAARVQHFSRGGKPLKLWSMKDHALGNPKGLCALPDGNILVCDTHYGRVLKMTAGGEILKIWGEPGKRPGQFVHPLSAAVDAKRGCVYVVEYGAYNDRVQKFDLDGTLLLVFGAYGFEPGQLNRPSGVAVDSAGFVYVADSCNHCIQKFDAEGRFVLAFGKEGNGDGELRYPYDIAYAADGRLYVAEFINHRVSAFETDGKFVRRFGSPGSGPDQFANPWSLAADASGRLLVSDTGNHRVRIVNLLKQNAANP